MLNKIIHSSLIKFTFFERHKDPLTILFADGVFGFASTVIFGILAVMVVRLGYSPAFAGLFMALPQAGQMIFTDALGGNLADSLGAKRTIQLGMVCFFLGLIGFAIAGYNIVGLSIFALFYFATTSLRVTSTYVMRTIGADEGGAIFGLRDSFVGLMSFVATLTFGFFLDESRLLLIFWVAAGLAAANLLATFFARDDLECEQAEKFAWKKVLNPLSTVRHGMHFIRENEYYPLLLVFYEAFNSAFYAGVWFLFPLYFASMEDGSFIDGLPLGIYEIVTVVLSGVVGVIADRRGWFSLGFFGSILLVVSLLLLPIFGENFWWLVAVGGVITVWDVTICGAFNHVVEEHDVDHAEDGSFQAFRSMFSNIFFTFVPITIGWVYGAFGFIPALWVICLIGAAGATGLAGVVYLLHKKELRGKQKAG